MNAGPPVYLNHAGTSWPKPEPVRAAVAAALAAPPETWGGRLEEHHAAVCRAFGVSDPGRLLLTPGATSALNVGVTDHPWKPGDRVVMSGFEHHALARPVRLLAERGVGVVVLPRTADAPLDLEALERELRAGGVRLVAMTAASNVTGEMLPVREITTLARAHGALSLIDAAQVAGWMPIDVEVLGVDLLAFTGHKGLQAPWGIGGLYVAPGVTMASPEATCEIPKEDGVSCAPMPGYCDVGSVDRAALAGLVAGLGWLDAPERADRLARARAGTERLAEVVDGLPELEILGPRRSGARLPTLAFRSEACGPGVLAAALAERSIVVSGGLQCAPLAHETLGTAPDGLVRLSAGPATTDAEIDAAAEALLDTLRRFGG